MELDFFISYAEDDKEWAEWIAWHLEKMGHKTMLRAWDLFPGHYSSLETQKATTNAKRTIAVLSPAYTAAKSTQPEWAASFDNDPGGNDRKLLPIIVKPVQLKGLLKTIEAIDLVGLTRNEAEKRLLEKIKASEDGKRNKPDAEPTFPEEAINTGKSNTIQAQNAQSFDSALNNPAKEKKYEDSPEFKVGLVDKVEQAKHVFNRINQIFFIKNEGTTPLAFLLYGAATQWPKALFNILYYGIKKDINAQDNISKVKISPEFLKLNGLSFKSNMSPEDYLLDLVAENLNCPPTSTKIAEELSKKQVPCILYRPLNNAEYQNYGLIQGMLEAWERLKLKDHSPRHILILYYDYSVKPKPLFLRWIIKDNSLIGKITKSAPKHIKENHILPEIKSPNKKLIHDWIDNHFKDCEQEVKDFVEMEINAEYLKRKQNKKTSKQDLSRIRITKQDIEIHHDDLKKILIKAFDTFGQVNT
jgi:hypothetical protein